MKKIVGFCPTCKYRLTAIALEEKSQQQVFEQNIAHSMFAQLSPAQTEFLSALVRCKGNHALMAQHLGLTGQEIESCFDRLLFDLKLQAVPMPAAEPVEPEPTPVISEEPIQPIEPDPVPALPVVDEPTEQEEEAPFLLPLDAPISEELMKKFMEKMQQNMAERKTVEQTASPETIPVQEEVPGTAMEQFEQDTIVQEPTKPEPSPEPEPSAPQPAVAQPEPMAGHRILPFCPPVVKREEVAFSPNPKSEEEPQPNQPQTMQQPSVTPVVSQPVVETEPVGGTFEEFLPYQKETSLSAPISASDVSASVVSACPTVQDKPSEWVKQKLLASGGSAEVSSVSKKTYTITANEDGKSFSCDKLPFECDYEVFDIICSLLDRQGGRADKGTGKGTRFGDAKCNETTVVGILAKEYFGAKVGDSVYDPVFVLAAVLEWAGLAKNGRGYLERIK